MSKKDNSEIKESIKEESTVSEHKESEIINERNEGETIENEAVDNEAVENEAVENDTVENEETLINENVKQPKFPMMLFLLLSISVVGIFLSYQQQVHYSFPYFPNKQIEEATNFQNKDRTIRLSIHSEDEKIAMLIDEKLRKEEYQGNFYLELANGKNKSNFQSEYFVDNYNEILKSGFYERFIEINKNTLKNQLEAPSPIIKYSLLGDRKTISTVNGKSTTFTRKLKGTELSQVLMLRDINLDNTVYQNWFNQENETRLALLPESKEFPGFRKAMNDFILLTNLKSAQIYSTFENNRLVTWGVDLKFDYVGENNQKKEWSVYFDVFYEPNNENIKREDLTEINSVLFEALKPDLYNYESNPYLNDESTIKVDGETAETDIGESDLDISLEELDKMLMNGSNKIIIDGKKENKETNK